MSDLIKFARARSDSDFVSRIAAAMTVRAQEIEGWDLEPSSRSMTDWVLENPMQPIDRMVSFVCTSSALAENMTYKDSILNTEGVPDADIQYVVNEKWDTVAERLYPS